LAIKRFCDWCEKEIETVDSYFIATVAPAEQAVFRGADFKKQTFEICKNCMNHTVEFIKERKASKKSGR